MSSLHFEKFQGIFFNLRLYQKHTPPPMFMTLLLEGMGALSVTKAHVAPRLPKSILNLLCSKYDFQIVQIQTKCQRNFRKSIIMVKVYRYLTILVVATHR